MAIARATASAHPRAHDAVARRPRSARSRALHGARTSRSRSAHVRTPRCAPGSWKIAEPVVIASVYNMYWWDQYNCWFFNFYSTKISYELLKGASTWRFFLSQPWYVCYSSRSACLAGRRWCFLWGKLQQLLDWLNYVSKTNEGCLHSFS